MVEHVKAIIIRQKFIKSEIAEIGQFDVYDRARVYPLFMVVIYGVKFRSIRLREKNKWREFLKA